MRIYTRSGDEGRTTGPGGRRVSKSDAAIRALGCLDELNAHVGLCLAACGPDPRGEIRQTLMPLQAELLTGGAMLAAPADTAGCGAGLDAAAVGRLEGRIDSIGAQLGALKAFILPRGSELTCRLHLARTVCRRAERAVVAWADAGNEAPPVVLQYLNRLSDLLFVLARLANHNAGIEDVTWPAGRAQ